MLSSFGTHLVNMKSSAFIFLLVLGNAFGSPAIKPSGIGAARGLPGKPDTYIVGGEIVQGREFPGQVSVQVYGYHNCGGSIVNENYTVTAAHCSKLGPDELKILSGTNHLNQGGTYHNVTEIHVHEEYDETYSWHNDIAIMKVDPPFVFDDKTAPVKLPQQGQETPVSSNATVIGWGYLSYRDVPNDLRKVNIFISDHDTCNQIYENDGFIVYPEQICGDTPEGGKGACNGDSGGPLFVDGEVIGLVSWSRGCAVKGYPTVYTEVSDYIDWINSKIDL